MIAATDTKDYRLDIRVRNARLLRAMHASGFGTAADLSRAAGVSQTVIGKYLSLNRAPYRDDQLRPTALKIALTLGRPVEDLWPPQHLHAPLRTSRSAINLSLDDIRFMASDFDVERIVEDRLFVRRLIARLNPRQRDVIERRYGIDRGKAQGLEEIARDMRITRERVRQIQLRAERQMRQWSEVAEATAENGHA